MKNPDFLYKNYVLLENQLSVGFTATAFFYLTRID